MSIDTFSGNIDPSGINKKTAGFVGDGKAM
jgi:hypothetical protein